MPSCSSRCREATSLQEPSSGKCIKEADDVLRPEENRF
ncbi:nitrite reductase [Prevotella denticola]|nr:nitrite reductase [Prevotella denticola]